MIVQEEIMKLIDRLVKHFNVVRFNEDGSPITESSKAAATPSAPAVVPSSAATGAVTAPAA